MRAYVVRRLLLVIPTLFLVSLILFVLIRMLPGGVVEQMVMQRSWDVEQGTDSALNAEAIRNMLGLDAPAPVQYLRWLGLWQTEDGEFSGIIQGNFGKSMWTNDTLLDMLRIKLPVTLELSILSLAFGLFFSVPIGVYAAIRQDTFLDYVGRTWSIMALALPSFWVATLVIVYGSIWLDWSPAIIYIPLVDDPLGNLGQFLLPAVILGMFTSGGLMRITRTMMLEVLRQDYIRTAWSKGLRERVVVTRHAAKNTLIPVITIVGGMIPALFGGSVIMEQIFNLPGMGRYLLQAIISRDYLIVSGHNLIFAAMVMLVIVATDLAYAFVDPRIRYK